MLKEKEKVHKQEKRKGFKSTAFVFFLLFASFAFSYLSVSAGDKESTASLDLENIEEKVFHEKFTTLPKEERLTKLENFLFGISSPKESDELRLNKITSSISSEKKEEPKKPQEAQLQKAENETPEIIYDESANTGIIGTISQIERRVFNKIYNELPFQKRVEQLEDRILSKSESLKNKKKTMLERVTILVQRINTNTQNNPQPPVIYPYIKQIPNNFQPYGQGLGQGPKTYTIDPNTGALINEQTGELVRDNAGNPITVRVPSSLSMSMPPEANYFPPNQNYGFGHGQGYGLPQNILTQPTFPNQLPANPLNPLNPLNQINPFLDQNDYGYGADPNY